MLVVCRLQQSGASLLARVERALREAMLLDAVQTLLGEAPIAIGIASSAEAKATCSRFYLGDHGLWVHARVAGAEKEGLPLVLLHGFGLGARVFDRQLAELGRDRFVAAIDFRGHGDSEWDPSVDYSVPALVEDLTTLLDGLGLDRCLLAGHSLGADVAVRFALQHPARVAGLALIDMGPELEEKGRANIYGWAHRMPSTFDTPDDFACWLAAQHPLAPSVVLQELARHWARPLPCGRYRRKLDPAFKEALFLPGRERRRKEVEWRRLRAITQPTYVIRGGVSAVLASSTAKRMVEELRSGELVTIDRAGHCPMLDNPAGMTDALERFVSAF